MVGIIPAFYPAFYCHVESFREGGKMAFIQFIGNGMADEGIVEFRRILLRTEGIFEIMLS